MSESCTRHMSRADMVMVCEHAARVARSGTPVRRAIATREALAVIEKHDLPWPDDVRAFYSSSGGWIGPVILAEDERGRVLIYSALLPQSEGEHPRRS